MRLPPAHCHIALLSLVVVFSACKKRQFNNVKSGTNAVVLKSFQLPEILQLEGEWNNCQPLIAEDFLKVKNALAGTGSGLFDICSEDLKFNSSTISANSKQTDREKLLASFELGKLVTSPGYTFLEAADDYTRAGAAKDAGRRGMDRKVILNIVTSSSDNNEEQGTVKSVDIWDGHERIVAALNAGVKTARDFFKNESVVVLVNGRTPNASENWPHLLHISQAPITLDLRSKFPISDVQNQNLQYDGKLSNFALGSRLSASGLQKWAKQKKRRAAYFIGTMNPPHSGHLNPSALYAGKSLGVDETIVLVNDAGHKPDAQHLFHRLNMSNLLVREIPKINMVNGSYSAFERKYGLDAIIRRLESVYGTDDIWTLVGADAYIRDIVKKNGGNLTSARQNLFVFPRKGEDNSELTVKPGLEKRIQIVNVEDKSGLSSTLMRKKLENSEPIDVNFMPKSVQDYIQKWCLYKIPDTKTCSGSLALSQYPGIKDASALHRQSTLQERYNIVKDIKLSQLQSAPGHAQLRSPANVLSIANDISKTNDRARTLFAGKDKMVLNVFTMENPPDAKGNKVVIVRSVEVLDGNHRLAAGLHSACSNSEKGWKTIGDIPLDYLDIRVNGFPTSGPKNPHWIPLQCARQSRFPADWWSEVPASAGAPAPSAQIDAGIPSSDVRFSDDCRGKSLLTVVEVSLQRIGQVSGKYRCAFDAEASSDD